MSPLSAPSIIVVDDEPELASLFKEFLTKVGYDVISFTDPVVALEYFKDTPDKHSLIITDLRMPGLNGIELAKKVRELNTNIKIFLITAFETRDLENHVERIWYIFFIEKAINLIRLIEVIQKF